MPRGEKGGKGGVLMAERCWAHDGEIRCGRRSGHDGRHIYKSHMWEDVKLPEGWGGGIDVDVEGMFDVIALRKKVRELEARLAKCTCVNV